MKKSALAILLLITLFSGISLASSSSSSSLVETPLLPTIKLSGLLLASAVSPEPALEPDFSQITLNPRLVSIPTAQGIIGPGFRASNFGDSMFNASLVSFVALNIADFISTKECLKYPHLAEGNPFMKPFVKSTFLFAAVKGGLTIATYLGSKALYKKSKPLAWLVSIATNLSLSYVVSNNFRLLRDARNR